MPVVGDAIPWDDSNRIDDLLLFVLVNLHLVTSGVIVLDFVFRVSNQLVSLFYTLAFPQFPIAYYDVEGKEK